MATSCADLREPTVDMRRLPEPVLTRLSALAVKRVSWMAPVVAWASTLVP